jgi:hypothetical protein
MGGEIEGPDWLRGEAAARAGRRVVRDRIAAINGRRGWDVFIAAERGKGVLLGDEGRLIFAAYNIPAEDKVGVMIV